MIENKNNAKVIREAFRCQFFLCGRLTAVSEGERTRSARAVISDITCNMYYPKLPRLEENGPHDVQ